MDDLPRVRLDAEEPCVCQCVVDEEAGMIQTYEEEVESYEDEVESNLMDECLHEKVVLRMGEIELHIKEGRWSIALQKAKRCPGKASRPHMEEAKYRMEYCKHYKVEAQRRLEIAVFLIRELRTQLRMRQAKIQLVKIQLVLTKYLMETANSHMVKIAYPMTKANRLEGPEEQSFNEADLESLRPDAWRQRVVDCMHGMNVAKNDVTEALLWVEEVWVEEESRLCTSTARLCTSRKRLCFEEYVEKVACSMVKAYRSTMDAILWMKRTGQWMEEAELKMEEELKDRMEEAVRGMEAEEAERAMEAERRMWIKLRCSMGTAEGSFAEAKRSTGVWRLVRGAIGRRVERLRRAEEDSVAKVDPEMDAEVANARLASFIEHHIQRKLHLLQPDNPIGAASASATSGEGSIVGDDDMLDEIRLEEVHSTVRLVQLGAPPKGKFNLCRNWSARLLSHPLLEPCLDELRRGGKDVKTPEGALILVRLDQYEHVRNALTEHQKKEGCITFYHVALATDVVSVEVLKELICHAFGAFAQRPRLKGFITELPLRDRQEMLEDFNSQAAEGFKNKNSESLEDSEGGETCNVTTSYSKFPLIVKNTFLIHAMDQPKLEDNFTRSANDASAPHDAAADEESATCQGLFEKPSTWQNPRRHATFCHCCQEEHRKLRKRVPVGRGMWNHSCRVFSEALAKRQRARKNGGAEVSEPGVKEPEVLSQVPVAPKQDRKSGAMGTGHGSSSSSGLHREQGRRMQSRSNSSHEESI